MSPSAIKDLIQFHVDLLRQYRGFIEPATVYLEEQTILALEAYLCIVTEAK